MYFLIAQGFAPVVRDAMTFGAALMTTGVANMATLIPSSPGYIGQFEFGVRLVLSGALGVPETDALAYAIILHAALYFPVTIWGIVEWFRQQLTIRHIREIDQNGDAALESEPA